MEANQINSAKSAHKANSAKDPLIPIGKILGAHGVKGMAKVASYTDTPENIAAYGPLYDLSGQKQWTITLHNRQKEHFLARLSGVETREHVQALNGTLLCVPRSKLPASTPDSTGTGEEEFLYADLIGLKAILEDGKTFGLVKRVVNYGASDILDIRRPDGAHELIAFTKVNVPHIDLDHGTLIINPPVMEAETGETGETGETETEEAGIGEPEAKT